MIITEITGPPPEAGAPGSGAIPPEASDPGFSLPAPEDSDPGMEYQAPEDSSGDTPENDPAET